MAGPGLVFVLSIVGPRDLVANSVAGSEYGYALIWLLAVAILARIAILESSARYVIVTGESLVAGCAKAGRWLVWMMFFIPFIKRFITGMVQLSLLGAAGHLLYPLDSPYSASIWAVGSWGMAFALLYMGRYTLLEKTSQPIAFLLIGSLTLAAFLSRPDWGAALKGAVLPSVPDAPSLYGSALVILSVAVGAIGSIGNVKYAALVHEKGWRGLEHLRSQRKDLVVSSIGMFIMLALVQVAAAGALHPLGIQVGEVEDLVPVFSQVLGEAGRVILALGIWFVVFTSVTGSSTAYALMLSDIYHRFLRPSDAIREQDQGRGAAYLPAFRPLLIIFATLPLMVLFTDWKPVPLLMVTAIVAAVLLPATIVVLLRLTTDRRFMGEHTNGWLVNATLVFAAITSLYLGYESILETFQ
ncbi:MAG: Nramp family divalent metal transporter [Bryobacterales bacterium]|nr:Nramp family divalent metal transporter [Bryobacterales bacterium]